MVSGTNSPVTGAMMANFCVGGSRLCVSDAFTSLVTYGSRKWMNSRTRNVGIGSSEQDLSVEFLMSRWTSSCGHGRNDVIDDDTKEEIGGRGEPAVPWQTVTILGRIRKWLLFTCDNVDCAKTVQDRPMVCIEVERNAGPRFRFLTYSTWYVHPSSPVMRCPIWVAVAIGIPATWRQIEQKFLLRGNGKSWVHWRFFKFWLWLKKQQIPTNMTLLCT